MGSVGKEPAAGREARREHKVTFKEGGPAREKGLLRIPRFWPP